MTTLIPSEVIEKRVLLIRGQKVMLSTDLAELYSVEPRVLVQAVKRNIKRFPKDFMFQLTKEEFEILRSQFVTSRWDDAEDKNNLKSLFVISSWGGARRAKPYAFTEQSVALQRSSQ